MNPCIEAFAVTLLGLLGAGAGWTFSRLRSRWWLGGFFLPLLLVLMIGAARRDARLEFVAPFSWLVAGRRQFALLAPLTTMLLCTPLDRLGALRQRTLVGAFAICFMLVTAVWPFLDPALVRSQLEGLKTRLDNQGICLQQTDYTCGPAAAVTALRRLGLAGEEGELAILMHTSRAGGTQPGVMAAALGQHYAAQGLICKYRYFSSIEELPRDVPTVAVIKFGLMVDHYITILKVTDRQVIIGDPLDGARPLTHDEFRRLWRFCGVTMRLRQEASHAT